MRMILLPLIVLAVLVLLPAVGIAQHSDGSIESSWENPRLYQPPAKVHAERPPAPHVAAPSGTDGYLPAWDRSRSPESRPWPYAQRQPLIKGDYYSSNAMLIDSLTSLYCLSSGYVKTLSNRNESGRAVPSPAPPQKKEFSYDQAPPAAKPSPARESLEALHRELLLLLDQCLYGR